MKQRSPLSETESSVDSVGVIVVSDVVLVVLVVVRHTVTAPVEKIVDDAALVFTGASRCVLAHLVIAFIHRMSGVCDLST
jgi:hypothetical protein